MTYPWFVDSLLETGPDIERSDATVCAGFFCSPESWPLLNGKEMVRILIAADLRHPYRVHSPVSLRAALEMDISDFSATEVRERLLNDGFDCVATETSAHGGPMVVVLRSETARIVVSEDGSPCSEI